MTVEFKVEHSTITVICFIYLNLLNTIIIISECEFMLSFIENLLDAEHLNNINGWYWFFGINCNYGYIENWRIKIWMREGNWLKSKYVLETWQVKWESVKYIVLCFTVRGKMVFWCECLFNNAIWKRDCMKSFVWPFMIQYISI